MIYILLYDIMQVITGEIITDITTTTAVIGKLYTRARNDMAFTTIIVIIMLL